MMTELLAPAGGREALVAAVQNGADAVYLGAGGFNARQTADNFGGDALREAIEYAHARGVKVYVTLNTMVREDELSALEDSIQSIARAGADAVLVQDFGVARAVRQIAPGLSLHASTQMAVHNRAGAAFLASQGFSRVVLAREMDLVSIRECASVGVELEVFVHGALCVSCSGQCLFSSLVGGRSGNRGRCAQPCRLRYRMNGEEGHLLSTRDLCAIDQLQALRDAGVVSFKIEGRLKRPEYVAVVTAAYREAIDHPERPRDVEALKQMFNRGGFTKGYLPGVEDMELMYPERPNHLGVEVGRCAKNGFVRLSADLDSADALVLRGKQEDRPVKLTGRSGENVACSGARSGDALVRLVSEAQMRAARESCEGERRAQPIRAALSLHVGEQARLTIFDETHEVVLQGETVEAAKSRAADLARIEAQIRKTGGTPYRMEDVRLDVDENAFCSVSELNALRRDALDKLTAIRTPQPPELHPLALPDCLPHVFADVPRVLLQSGDAAQLRNALALGADGVIFAPEDVRADALAQVAQTLPERFSLAIPMVLGQKSLETLHTWARSVADRIDATYLSNIGQLDFDWPGRLAADYSLNVANSLAIEQMREWGMQTFTPSLELNAAQIEALDGPRELIVHGRFPLMQLRHCPNRAALKLPGKHADCRRCDGCAPEDHVNAKSLTDRTGANFPLRRIATDEGCVVQVLNCVPTMTLKRVRKLPKADAWRLLVGAQDDLAGLIRLYRAAACGEDFRSDGAWPYYETMNTTTGHYFRGAE